MFRITIKNDSQNQGKKVKVMVPVTSESEYRADRNSARNLSVLSKVRALYDDYHFQATCGVDAETLREKKNAIDHEKSGLVQYVYSCVPGEDMLLKGCTRPSPWVGMDVDFDPADPDFEKKKAEASQRILAMADELGLGMLENSPGKGCHIAFRRHPDLTQEGNLKWASDLIGCKYDEKAKDLTRVFFTTSASSDDLLFLSPDMFAPEANQHMVTVDNPSQTTTNGQTAVYVSTETAQSPAATVATTATVKPNPAAHFYQGFSFTTIIDKYNELFNNGKAPCAADHNRNSWTYEWALNARCIREFSPESVMEVTPIYDGLPVEEWKKCIESACSQERKGMTYRMRQVLAALNKERKAGTMPMGMTSQTPPLYKGRLPEPLRKIASRVPDFLKTTVTEGSFGALATHLHGVTFELIDGSISEPAIMQIDIYRQSSGKGCVDMPIECINEDLMLHDAADRVREDEWKRNNPSGGKKQPIPEDIYVQICQSDMTNAGFVNRLMQCHRNGQRPIFVHMVELDEITALMTNGKNDVTRIIRKAFDRKPYGQERVSSDAVSGVAPCRFNFTAATTPVRAIKMCSPWAADGTLSRINLITIDPNVNSEKVRYKIYDKRYKDSIAPYIARLNNATGLIHCKKALQLAERLRDQLENDSAGADSDAIATFAPRAVTIAYWKAMILYIMTGKWTKDIENYAEWSLKRDIWVKLHFFGKKMEDDLEAENNLEAYHPKNILEILNHNFSEAEFIQARQRLGLKGNHKEHLKKLRQRKQIDFDDTSQLFVNLHHKSE